MPSLPCWSFWGPFLLLVFFCGVFAGKRARGFLLPFPPFLSGWDVAVGGAGIRGVCVSNLEILGVSGRSFGPGWVTFCLFFFFFLLGRGGIEKLFSCLSLSLSFLSLPGGRERWPAGTWLRIRQNSSEKIKLFYLPKELFLIISTCFVHKKFFVFLTKQF